MAETSGLPEPLREQIEDALERGHADRLPREPTPRPSPPRRPRLPDLRPRSPSQVLLISALVALAAWTFRFPYSREVLAVALVGLALGFITWLLRPQGRGQHYWRGRPVDMPPDSWTERVYRWLYRG